MLEWIEVYNYEKKEKKLNLLENSSDAGSNIRQPFLNIR